MSKRILFQQGVYQSTFDQAVSVSYNCTTWDSLQYSQHGNAIYVELRAYGMDDYIIEEIVFKNKVKIIHHKRISSFENEFEHIRHAINRFDSLFTYHVRLWDLPKETVVEEGENIEIEAGL